MSYPQRLFTQGVPFGTNRSFLTHPGNRVHNFEVMGNQSVSFASSYGSGRTISGSLTPQIGTASQGFSTHSYNYAWRVDGWGDSTNAYVATTPFQHHLFGLAGDASAYPFIAGFFMRPSASTTARCRIESDTQANLVTGTNRTVPAGTGQWVTVKGTIPSNRNAVRVVALESTASSATTVYISSFFFLPDYDALMNDGIYIDYTIEGVTPTQSQASSHGFIVVAGEEDFVGGGQEMAITPSTAAGSTNWKMSQSIPANPNTYMSTHPKGFGTNYGWPYRKVGWKMEHNEWIYGVNCAINCIEHVRDGKW